MACSIPSRVQIGVRRTILSAAALAVTAACQHSQAPLQHGPSGAEVEIGYGARQHRDLTGAVSSVDEEDLGHRRAGRVEELLEGVPGLLVNRLGNGEFSLQIRGARSLLGSNEPLVVIDGMPISPHGTRTALSLLHPNRVRRIDVLRDAGSTAAFGSRGANGVILITTHRAR